MNAIATAIQSEELAGTAAEIAAEFAADVVLSTDNTRWSYQGVAEMYGAEVAGVILVLMETAIADESLSVGMRATLRAELASFQLGSKDGLTGGLDMSRPERQAQMATWVAYLTSVGQDAAASAVMLVMRLGVVRGPLWTKPSLGISVQPDEAACADALAEIANPPVITYDRRAVLLSLNMDVAAMLNVRVVESGTANGANVTGSTLAQFGISDADNATLTDAQRTMVDAVLTAVRAYTETL